MNVLSANIQTLCFTQIVLSHSQLVCTCNLLT